MYMYIVEVQKCTCTCSIILLIVHVHMCILNTCTCTFYKCTFSIQAADANMETHTLARYISESTLQEYSMITIKPSLIAAGSMYLAIRMKKLGTWVCDYIHCTCTCTCSICVCDSKWVIHVLGGYTCTCTMYVSGN